MMWNREWSRTPRRTLTFGATSRRSDPPGFLAGETMMAVPFYDNLEATLIDDVSCLVEVERVYGFDWARFDEGHWQRLARIYEDLPGAVRHRDVPWWFGDDEDVPPFLRAS